MKFEEIIGLAAGVFTSVSLLPQLVKTIKEKEAKNLSLGMLFVLIAGNGLWISYGAIKNDMPILSTNIFSEIVNITLIIFTIKYKKKEA